MKEFNDGFLVLRSENSLVQAALADWSHPSQFKEELNERWSSFFLEKADTDYYTTRIWLLRHSHKFPMLYFQDSGDHGWVYSLFHEGQQKAWVEVNYDLHYKFWLEIAELLYPTIDPHTELDDSVSERIDRLVSRSDGYRDAIKVQYAHANVKEFSVFGLSTEELVQLSESVHASHYQKETIYKISQMDLFKQILRIPEMRWIVSAPSNTKSDKNHA